MRKRLAAIICSRHQLNLPEAIPFACSVEYPISSTRLATIGKDGTKMRAEPNPPSTCETTKAIYRDVDEESGRSSHGEEGPSKLHEMAHSIKPWKTALRGPIREDTRKTSGVERAKTNPMILKRRLADAIPMENSFWRCTERPGAIAPERRRKKETMTFLHDVFDRLTVIELHHTESELNCEREKNVNDARWCEEPEQRCSFTSFIGYGRAHFHRCRWMKIVRWFLMKRLRQHEGTEASDDNNSKENEEWQRDSTQTKEKTTERSSKLHNRDIFSIEMSEKKPVHCVCVCERLPSIQLLTMFLWFQSLFLCLRIDQRQCCSNMCWLRLQLHLKQALKQRLNRRLRQRLNRWLRQWLSKGVKAKVMEEVKQKTEG